MANSRVIAYRFGPFRLSVSDRMLERDEERVPLTPKVIDTLFVLVENARQVVTKDDLMRAVWPDVTVVESGLTRNISVLRRALEEGMQEGSVIETIPRRGYRFIAEVIEETSEDPLPAPVAAQAQTNSGRNRRILWGGVATVGASAVVAAVLLLADARPDGRARVEPDVSIGTHLLYKLAPEQSDRAVQHFEQAITASPRSAAAHAGLAIALLQTSALGVRTLSEVRGRAELEAKKALELDPDLVTALYAHALVQLVSYWNLPEAEKYFRRAIATDPSSVQSFLGYTQLKFATGEVNDALRLAEEALRLDPASPLIGARYCQAFYYARDFHRAEAECRRVLDREPHYALAQYYLGLSLGWLGRTKEAHQVFGTMSMMTGVLEADRAWLDLREGNRGPALEALQRRRDMIRGGELDASSKLLLAASLGLLDEAYEAIDTAIGSRAIEMLTLRIEPRLDPIRSDPRYARVLQRLGLTAADSRAGL